MTAVLRRTLPALTRLLLCILCVFAPGGCSGCICSPDALPVPPRSLLACRTHTPGRPTPGDAGGTNHAPAQTVPAGTLPGTFSITSSGNATYVMPLVTVPGRAGMEPQLSLVYDSSAGDGVLGVGFALGGISAITRCPSNLAQDGEIRGVRYDASDKLCLDGKRLIPVGQAPGTLEYRTLPDTLVKVIGHFPEGGEATESAL